jgi:hypothetical protein
MRVGRAFSLLLDPSRPLFADMGDLLLAPDEAWPGAEDFATQEPARHPPAPAGPAGRGAGGLGAAAAAQPLDPDEEITSWGGGGGGWGWGGPGGEGWGPALPPPPALLLPPVLRKSLLE